MIDLVQVPATHIDGAWADGAYRLAEACDVSGGEITGDQLKFILSRGERILLRMLDDGQTVGWGCVRIDQMPNVRALHICGMWAPGFVFDQFWPLICEKAREAGCSEVRHSSDEVRSRLYRMKCGFEPLYTTCRVKL